MDTAPIVNGVGRTGVHVNVGDAIVGDVSNTNFPVPVAPVAVTPSVVICPVKVGLAVLDFKQILVFKSL
jgi:hypothetical protein